MGATHIGFTGACTGRGGGAEPAGAPAQERSSISGGALKKALCSGSLNVW